MLAVVVNSTWMIDRSLSQDYLIDQVAPLIELEEMTPSTPTGAVRRATPIRAWKSPWTLDDFNGRHEEVFTNLGHSLRVIDAGSQMNGTQEPKAQKVHPLLSHERTREGSGLPSVVDRSIAEEKLNDSGADRL
jgi:hypothetical protein